MCVLFPPSLRQDECGTPYRVIADEATLESGVVSVQERNTTAQVSVCVCHCLSKLDP